MSIGPFQILIVLLVIILLFGRGRISEMMGDYGKGIKSFRQGLSEDDKPAMAPRRIEASAHEANPAEAAAEPRAVD